MLLHTEIQAGSGFQGSVLKHCADAGFSGMYNFIRECKMKFFRESAIVNRESAIVNRQWLANFEIYKRPCAAAFSQPSAFCLLPSAFSLHPFPKSPSP